MTLKELLKGKLTKKELALVPSSFDIIGNKDKAIAIVELDDKIKKKAKTVANALMKKHKNVKSVLLKASPRSGVFRTREYKVIGGDKKTEVVHAENGCRFLVDPVSVYFSQRESTERQRITELVKKDEVVMVFFAGVGPFAIEIAKKCSPKSVIGIEINPVAVDYFFKNIKLNKLENVEVLLGDVAEKAKEFYNKCDHVLMPLPEKAMDYLNDAIKCLKKGGVCHFYCFSQEDKLKNVKTRINHIATSMGKKIKFLHVQKVLPYGPKIWKYRIDFRII
ncbi:MAG: class I SAM-dependent methyltransferase family protein [Candidatus Aenigmarchaeota archaeon]|nr:class I SAM-dependent methyltransferase family protein [Candidatus Aenigmarchaeota archaeon]